MPAALVLRQRLLEPHHAEVARGVGDLERGGQREDLAAVDHQLDARRDQVAQLVERGEVGAPLGPDAHLDHRARRGRAAGRAARRCQAASPSSRNTLRRVHGDAVAGPAEQSLTPSARPPCRRGPTARSRRRCGPRARPPVAEAAAGEQAHPLGQPLDRVELLADEQRGQGLGDDRRQHAGERAAVAVARLAVADQPVVGLDAHEAVRQRVALERERRRQRRDAR